jgi:hypothetical protein
MSNTNENDELLNSSNNEGSDNEGSNLGTESGNNDSNNDSENNNEGEDVTDKGGNGNTAANSGGTPSKDGRPKPNAGVGVFGLR